MNKVLHRASSRGHANHGWLDSHHSFSFANYYNPERMHFGVLRVLNDDRVAGGAGFGKHPHENMEIVSIPLSGDLEHEDSMGNKKVIRAGDIQVMSAGTGVLHSEYNQSKTEEVKFLQIWIFPNKKNVSPRYDQISIQIVAQKNTFYQILSPNEDDQGVWIHQNAWFSMGEFEAETSENYKLHQSINGVYLFVLDGKIEIAGEVLNRRDAIGIWETEQFELTATNKAKVLLMEVPMEFS
jgi:redox-sensitive bicupin YhaK (pirin superfamily)